MLLLKDMLWLIQSGSGFRFCCFAPLFYKCFPFFLGRIFWTQDSGVRLFGRKNKNFIAPLKSWFEYNILSSELHQESDYFPLNGIGFNHSVFLFDQKVFDSILIALANMGFGFLVYWFELYTFGPYSYKYL